MDMLRSGHHRRLLSGRGGLPDIHEGSNQRHSSRHAVEKAGFREVARMYGVRRNWKKHVSVLPCWHADR
jgi:hypothetical protein